MGDWLTRLLPWYDEETQLKKERKSEAVNLQARRAVNRSQKAIDAYQAASAEYRKEVQQHG